MKVENNINSINFGQKVQTRPLLRIGSGIFNFEDAKSFCNSIEEKFPGNMGYYRKARNIIDRIKAKNPQINEILSKTESISNPKEKLSEISKQATALGEEIDVVI